MDTVSLSRLKVSDKYIMCIFVIFTVILLQRYTLAFTHNTYDFYSANSRRVNLERSDYVDYLEQKKHEHLIRKEILHMLGLHHAPRPLHSKRKNAAPQFMLELYKQMEYDNEGFSEMRYDNADVMTNLTSHIFGSDVNSADMVVSFRNNVVEPAFTHASHETIFSFEANSVPDIEHVTIAELRIYKTRCHAGSGAVTLHLSKLKDNQREMISESSTECEFEGWLELDVTSLVAEWLFMGEGRLELVLSVTDSEASVQNVGIEPTSEEDDVNEAFIVAAFSSTPKKKKVPTATLR